MDGLMDGNTKGKDDKLIEWMDRWMSGCTDQLAGLMDRQMNGWMDGCMDEWIDGWMNLWMDGWMGGCMD